MCSLRVENNLLTVEVVRFASISKKTPLSKLSFASVSLALPLLDRTTSKAAITNKNLGHFPPASQAGRLAGPVFYAYVFSLVLTVRAIDYGGKTANL